MNPDSLSRETDTQILWYKKQQPWAPYISAKMKIVAGKMVDTCTFDPERRD